MHIVYCNYGRRVLFWKIPHNKLSASQAAIILTLQWPPLHSLFSFSVLCSDQLSRVCWPSLHILITNAEQLYALLLDSCLAGQVYFDQTKQIMVFLIQIIISDAAFLFELFDCIDNELNKNYSMSNSNLYIMVEYWRMQSEELRLHRIVKNRWSSIEREEQSK